MRPTPPRNSEPIQRPALPIPASSATTVSSHVRSSSMVFASRTNGIHSPRRSRWAVGSACLRSPLFLEDPVDHQVAEPVGGSDAVPQHALLTHPQALGDRATPRVRVGRAELHPMQAELLEGEVEEPPARARDDPPPFELGADPIADLAGGVGDVDPKTHGARETTLDPDPIALDVGLDRKSTRLNSSHMSNLV